MFILGYRIVKTYLDYNNYSAEEIIDSDELQGETIEEVHELAASLIIKNNGNRELAEKESKCFGNDFDQYDHYKIEFDETIREISSEQSFDESLLKKRDDYQAHVAALDHTIKERDEQRKARKLARKKAQFAKLKEELESLAPEVLSD